MQKNLENLSSASTNCLQEAPGCEGELPLERLWI